VAIATGRRTAYTTPLLDGLGLRADTPLITSNGAVIRTLGGDSMAAACSRLKPRAGYASCSGLRGLGFYL